MAKRIEISKFKKRSDFRSSLTVLAHLILVFAPVCVAAFLGPSLWWIALWLAFGFLMNGLLNLIHECAHYHVFTSRQGSDFLGHWVMGPLALSDFDAYRWRHWKHHTNFGIDGDPKYAYLVDIRGSRLIALFRCLTLSEALHRFRHAAVQSDTKERTTSSPVLWLARTAIFQVLLFGLIFLIAGPWAGRARPQAFLVAALAYSLVYGYGLASLTVFATTLRAVAEHQLEAGQHPAERRGTLRNFTCGPVSRVIFGAYGFAEHATHHIEPSLPYYHLPEATNEMAKDDPELLPNHRYWRELALLARNNPRQPFAGETT